MAEPAVSTAPAAPAVSTEPGAAPVDAAPAEVLEQVNTYTVRFEENDLTAGIVWVEGQSVDTTYYTKDTEEGSDFTFQVTANEGWKTESVKVNDLDIEKTANPDEYIIRNVTTETVIKQAGIS